ncbi:MAG: hypothetical protein HXX09_02990 [Bacteroidetes bacterium]|nr:hypothetical protein [Bacteroidota bacterium]
MKKIFFISVFLFTSLMGFHYLPIDSDIFFTSNNSCQSEMPSSNNQADFHIDNLEDDFLFESIGILFSRKTIKTKLEIFLAANEYLNPSLSFWQPPKIVI